MADADEFSDVGPSSIATIASPSIAGCATYRLGKGGTIHNTSFYAELLVTESTVKVGTVVTLDAD